MATTPPAEQPMLLYNSVVPLQSTVHANHGVLPRMSFPEVVGVNAIPLTVDEFSVAQRFYPIVFGVGENAAPLALLGVKPGSNLFVDDNGEWKKGVYVPAFLRRHPFLLASLADNATELTLCFDDTSPLVKENEGDPLFKDGEKTAALDVVMNFCEQFEQSVQRTRSFMEELEKMNMIVDCEVTIQKEGVETPSIYRGFRMVGEEKVQELRGDQARKMVQNGMLGLIYAHLFSLASITELHQQQMLKDGAGA